MSLAFALCAVVAFSAHAEGYKSEPQDVRPVKQDPAAAAAHEASASEPVDKEDADGNDKEPAAVLKGDLDFSVLELLAIQENSRKKPLQTYAYEQIEQLCGRAVFAGTPYLKEKATGDKIQAMDLLLSLWFNTRNWRKTPVILVAYGPLKVHIGLAPEDKHFSVEQLSKCTKLQELWDSGEKKRLAHQESEMDNLEKEAEIVHKRLMILWTLMNADEKLIIIPHPKNPKGDWISLAALTESQRKMDGVPYYSKSETENVIAKFLALRASYRARKADDFLRASQEFRATIAALSPTVYPGAETLEREVGYNKLRPFGRAWMFYFVAVVLGLLSLKFSAKPLYWALMTVYSCGLAFQVYGFALRCIIAGRPPVSNMYESVIWVGFGAVAFGLVFELIYKRRYFALAGAAAGCMCLVLTDMLPVVMGNAAMPGLESYFSPLQPVLRDNYWLTVHVLTITLSYAAFMLTCFLGHITLWKHLVDPGAKIEQRELHQFVYRGIQVGVLLLAIGTILGGAWAYKSWGRFWGWDPKETWAFISLMCSLVVLHGRFAGWWGNFGLSVGSVFCFWPIVMAWYGVNFVLGSGMHSYGSGAGGKEIVITAACLDLAFALAAVARYQAFNKKPHVFKLDDDDNDEDSELPSLKETINEKLTPSDPVMEARAVGEAAGE